MADRGKKHGGWLGRVIVVLVVWVALAAGAYYALMMLIGGGTGGAAPRPAEHATAVPPADWTPEAIADRPVAFLEAAIARARGLAAAKERRLAELSRQREAAQGRADERQRTLTDQQNVRDRLERAYRGARDEGRATFQMAGRTFDREQAEQMLAELEKELAELRPLAEGYAQTATGYETKEAELRDEVEALRRLGERLQLDLERARLDVANVSTAELQRVDAQLDAMSDH